MKKVIDIDNEDVAFMKDYKKSHGVSPSAFIDIAIREKIVKTKAEIKLQEYVSNK